MSVTTETILLAGIIFGFLLLTTIS
jgi:hypothetical protein